MRNTIFFLFISLLLFLLSCTYTEDACCVFGYGRIRVVLLDVAVKNEMETPITIKIRHTYFWGSGSFESSFENGITMYSEWVTEYLDSDERKPIGVEKVITSAGEELEGFVLLDERFFGLTFRGLLISSFELEIETIDDTFIIPGYTSTGIGADGDICKLIVDQRGCSSCGGKFQLNTYKQSIQLFRRDIQSFILPVTITIKSDGSFSFEHEDVKDSDDIVILTELEK